MSALRILLGTLAFLAAPGSGFAQSGTWASKAPLPVARSGMGFGELGGQIYSLGGFTGTTSLNAIASVDRFDPATNTWTARAPLPTPRLAMTVVSVGGKLYSIGGTPAGGVGGLTQVDMYDPSANTWTSRAPMPGAGRAATGGGVIGGVIYVVGGYSSGNTLVPTLEAYDPVANSWATKAPLPTARYSFATAVLEGKLYVIGGIEPGNAVVAKVHAYDPTTNSWTSRAPLPSPRSTSAAAVVGNRIVVVGGTSPTITPHSETLSYDPTTNVWTTLAAWPTPRFNPAAASVGGAVYVVGGQGPNPYPAVANNDAFTPAAVAALTVSVDSTSLDFGGQSMGTVSAARSVTVTNTGTASVSISSIASSTSQFVQTNDCAAITPGGKCTIQVAFAPAAAAGALNSTVAINGSLTIASNAAGSPHTVALAGVAEKSLVTHYYRAILRRAPDAGGKAFWSSEAARVADLGANVNEVWHAMTMAFFTSVEYTSVQRTTSGYVTDLYNTFFNRAPDAGGLSFWTGQIDGGMPREVALTAFMFSAEFGNFTRAIFGDTAVRAEIDMVVDFFRGMLSRLPDSGGYEFWVEQFRLAQCRGEAGLREEAQRISSQFLTSAEYAARNRTATQYVGDLYNAFLRRGGDLGGVTFWINQLATAQLTREQVRAAFAVSPEFNSRVAKVVEQGCSVATQTTMVSAAQGGTITAPNGFSVTIPAGALSRDQAVIVENYLAFPVRVPNPVLATIGPALGILASWNADSTGDVVLSLRYATSLAGRLEGSGAVAAFLDFNGTYHLAGLRGSFDSTSNTATIRLRPEIASRVQKVVVGMVNLVETAAAESHEKILVIPKAGPVRWNGEAWVVESISACPPPGSKVLVLVHGMNSSVQAAFGGTGSSCPSAIGEAGKYDIVLGFNYDWTARIHDSGQRLRNYLNALASCGISQLDLEAHSEGGPVVGSALTYPATLAPATSGLVKNMVAVASPWWGTPVAYVGDELDIRTVVAGAYIAIATGLINSPNTPAVFNPRTFANLLVAAFAKDMQSGSLVLDEIRRGLARPELTVNMVFAAGKKPNFSDWPGLRERWVKMFGAADDDIVDTISARAEAVGIAKATRLHPYTLSHTELTCSADVIRDVGISLEGACPLEITPLGDSATALGMSTSFMVKSGDGCPWFASSNQPWLTLLDGGSGSGSEPVRYSVAPNTTSLPRQGTITVKFLDPGSPPKTLERQFLLNQAAGSGAAGNLALFPPNIVVSNRAGTASDDSPLRPTDTVYLDFVVANTGSGSLTNTSFNVELFVDGILRKVWPVSPPHPPNSALLTVVDYPIVGTLSSGSRTLTISIDRANLIPESDETDNEFSKTVTVTDLAPGQYACSTRFCNTYLRLDGSVDYCVCQGRLNAICNRPPIPNGGLIELISVPGVIDGCLPGVVIDPTGRLFGDARCNPQWQCGGPIREVP